jgi:hypothetical protein
MGLPKNYYNYFEICKIEGISTEEAKRSIGYEGLKGIHGILKLRPIAHLFREFPNGMRKQYGILRTHYDYWKRTGEPPKVSPGRPAKWSGEEKNINIPAPPFYEQFKAGVKKANAGSVQQVTVRQCIYLAMKEYMDRRPAIFYGVDEHERSNKSAGS